MKDQYIHSKVPLLLLRKDESGSRDLCDLYSISEKKIISTIPLPEARDKYCIPRREEMETVPAWSDLPPELLLEIAIKLTVVIDFKAFREVCSSWRAAATKDKFIWSKLPLLLLTEDYGCRHDLYSLSEGKIISTLKLPVAKNKCCTEAGFGWIMAIQYRGNHMTLFKPFCQTKIHLPPEYGLGKARVLLSADPSETSNFVVFLLDHYDSRLMILKNGDEKWMQITANPKRWENISYYNGKIYGIDFNQDIWVWDPHGSDQTLARLVLHVGVVRARQNNMYMVESSDGEQRVVRALQNKMYMVESSDGELLIIVRDETINRAYLVETLGFRLYRVDLKKQECREIHCLGEDAVFLGDSAAISVAAADFPGVVRSDCIYFTDGGKNTHSRDKDMGIYNVEEKSFERLEVGTIYRQCSPMWITLSF